MSIPPIKVGDPVTAALLNRLIEAANQLQGLGTDGAPGAGIRVGAVRKTEYAGAVVGRTVPGGDPPYKLHQIEYEINCPPLRNDGPLVVPWTRRIVPVPAHLNGPDADPAMLYYPAPVIGTSEQTLTPWRGYCTIIVYHGVGSPEGPPVWFADVWGETPAYGCEAEEEEEEEES